MLAAFDSACKGFNKKKKKYHPVKGFQQQPLHFNRYPSSLMVNTQKQYDNSVLVNAFLYK
jgi:hypothetical protein